MLTSWPQLRAAYKASLPEITSMQAWAETFGVDLDEPVEKN
jgi:galactofuranosylgalactofuranosylrhamnosyl-N-acetylglucosaminyl-diphospho-decaprenol beta-1,5/1,6-galactofuranosyltransferase